MSLAAVHVPELLSFSRLQISNLKEPEEVPKFYIWNFITWILLRNTHFLQLNEHNDTHEK
jgi:hypothetical protein